ncbi:MAG: thiamine pyrophosphate-dependent dehydrogenase E1 component subunit alpha [Eubacteriaceae bacterium]
MKKIKKTDKDLYLNLLKYMHLARKFEEKVQHYFSLGMIHGTTHLGIGEEGVAAGTCLALKPQDHMYATHRGHCQAVCKGIDINEMMAEIFAKETGVCKGRGGSMHIADRDKGVMGANGILGPALPLACGSAFANVRRGEKDVVTLAFFGDGAANEGAVHEAMNLAAVWNLPVMFILVNNTYGMSTHISKASKDIDLTKRAYPFGMRAVEVDGNDVLAVYQTISEAREYVVAGNGPILVVENTYRTSGHSKSDGNMYRSKEEINAWKKKAPIPRWSKVLLEEGICTQEELEIVDKETTKIINDSVEFALNSPDPKLEDIYVDVYAD